MIFKYWRLYMSNLTGFLSYMCVGAIIAYPSPAFPTMKFGKDNESLSTSMNSWLASFDGLFAIPGSILVIPIMNIYGRKLALLVITIPMTLGWLLGVCSYNIPTLALSRAVTGLSLGMELGCLFVYIAEISPKNQRGIIGAIPNIFLAFGSILVNLLGNFINWRWNALMCLIMSLLAAFAAFFIYETPRWLINKGHRTAAIDIMRKLWLMNEDELTKEADDIENNVKLINSSTYLQTFIQIFKPPLWKPLIISQLLIALQQLTGTAYINSYTVEIFREASVQPNNNTANNTHLIDFDNPYYQSSIVWLSNVIGTVVSVFVIDRFGRRILLTSNTIFITISMAAIGAYYYLKPLNLAFDLHYLHWVPITSLLIFNFCFGAGFAAIPYLMLSEMFPIQTRTVASGLGMFSRNVYFFVVAKVFPTSKVLPIYGIYWVFAGVGLLGLIFVIFFVPETKGRSLEEIQQQWYTGKHSNLPKTLGRSGKNMDITER